MSEIFWIELMLNTAVSLAFVVEFDDADLSWFRKPLATEEV